MAPKPTDKELEDMCSRVTKEVDPMIDPSFSSEEKLNYLRGLALMGGIVRLGAITYDNSQEAWREVMFEGELLISMQFDVIIDNWGECYVPGAKITRHAESKCYPAK